VAQSAFDQLANDPQQLPVIIQELKLLNQGRDLQRAHDMKVLKEMEETKKGAEETVAILKLIYDVNVQQLDRANLGKSLLAQQTEKLLSDHAANTYQVFTDEIARFGTFISRKLARYNCLNILIQLLYTVNEKDGSTEALNQVEEAVRWFVKQLKFKFLDDSVDYLQIPQILRLVSNLHMNYEVDRTVFVEQPACCGTPIPNPQYGAALKVTNTLAGTLGIPMCTNGGIFTIPLAAFTTESLTAIQTNLREYGFAVLRSNSSFEKMTDDNYSGTRPTLLYTGEEKLTPRGFFGSLCCEIPLRQKLGDASLWVGYNVDFLNAILRHLIYVALGLTIKTVHTPTGPTVFSPTGPTGYSTGPTGYSTGYSTGPTVYTGSISPSPPVSPSTQATPLLSGETSSGERPEGAPATQQMEGE